VRSVATEAHRRRSPIDGEGPADDSTFIDIESRLFADEKLFETEPPTGDKHRRR